MKNITWKYVKPLVKEESIAEYEKMTGVSLPDDIKTTIRTNNGGRPSFKYYDIAAEHDKEFKSLLSFNKDDIESVFSLYPLDSSDKHLVPFATDPAGNCFVIKDGKIFLWLHEVDKTIFLAYTFTDFLASLHD